MRLIFVGLLWLSSVIAVAQDWSWATLDADGLVKVNAAKVRGVIATGGSSTVFPLAQYVAEQFRAEGYTGQLSIDNIGTGAGLKRFGAGEVDFANASRAIVPAERRAAESRGKGKVLEFRLAQDAIVIFVNAKNTWVKNLDDEQVQAAFATADTWSDVDPTWPREPIRRFIPETSHGTFDFFQEKFWDDKGTLLKSAPNLQRFQDFNQLVAAVEREAFGIAFVGYSYFKESENTRAVPFKAVLASRSTVDDGTYQLARYLYTYVNLNTLTTKPQTAGFLAFLLNYASRAAAKVGYFPLTPAELVQQKRALADVLKGKF